MLTLNYAKQLNHWPIKRTIPMKTGLASALIEVWNSRGYIVHIKEGQDYYFIYRG